MSAYITLATPMLDQESLVLALADLGFGPDRLEVHETAVQLVGYEGDLRRRRGHVVIRKEHVGPASNDIGFERTPTGFRAHVSDYDRGRYGRSWLHQLVARYRHHDAEKQERLAQELRAAQVEARRKAEVEARRREEDRQRLVEAQRQSVHEKARAMGYRVQETRDADRIRLVLVKRVY